MKLIPVSKKMIIIVVAISVLAAIVGVFIVDKPVPYLLGILIGGASSCIRVMLINKSVAKAITLEPAQARLYATGQYYIRFLLTIAVLVASAVIPIFNMFGAIIGVLAFNIAAYTSHFLKGKVVNELN